MARKEKRAAREAAERVRRYLDAEPKGIVIQPPIPTAVAAVSYDGTVVYLQRSDLDALLHYAEE